jgi:hypothetical protein
LPVGPLAHSTFLFLCLGVSVNCAVNNSSEPVQLRYGSLLSKKEEEEGKWSKFVIHGEAIATPLTIKAFHVH